MKISVPRVQNESVIYVCVPIHSMVSKNIAITKEAYNILSRHKKPGESFSEVIVDTFTKKKKLSDFAGIWSDIPDKKWKELENNIKDARKGLNMSLQKRIKKNKL